MNEPPDALRNKFRDGHPELHLYTIIIIIIIIIIIYKLSGHALDQ